MNNGFFFSYLFDGIWAFFKMKKSNSFRSDSRNLMSNLASINACITLKELIQINLQTTYARNNLLFPNYSLENILVFTLLGFENWGGGIINLWHNIVHVVKVCNSEYFGNK